MATRKINILGLEKEKKFAAERIPNLLNKLKNDASRYFRLSEYILIKKPAELSGGQRQRVALGRANCQGMLNFS